jgi:hypothetical protein
LTIDGRTYNLGQPSYSKHVDPGCHRSLAVAVSFGIDRNFLIAILCCIVVLLILILAVVVHRKSYDGVSFSLCKKNYLSLLSEYQQFFSWNRTHKSCYFPQNFNLIDICYKNVHFPK